MRLFGNTALYQRIFTTKDTLIKLFVHLFTMIIQKFNQLSTHSVVNYYVHMCINPQM